MTLIVLPMFAAFEAHVINVTAQIENALNVPVSEIKFGTVFPQEHLNQPLRIALSGSFMEEDRVDDVNYFIRQKPKCAVTARDGEVLVGPTGTGHVMVGDNPATTDVVEDHWIDCGPEPRELEEGETWGVLPSLCEYISKEDDQTPDNDGSMPSFHLPWTIVDGQIVWNDTPGRLAKSEQDTEDNWVIDLAVPCFGGYCAQDWADFVHSINPDANPDDYTQPIDDEHKIFGCDLWVEVTEVSETGTTTPVTTLTVVKTVVNDNNGTAVAGDFSFMVDGGAVTSFEGDGSNVVLMAPGDHTIAELAVGNYTATIGGDCDANGNVSIPEGTNKTCTITNNDNPPEIGTLTVTKVVVNDDGGTAVVGDFLLNVSGEAVLSGVSHEFAPGNYNVAESGLFGYSASFGGDCAANGTITINVDDNKTCTITNNDIPPSITLIKSVVGGTAAPDDFDLSIDGVVKTSGSSNQVSANAAHALDEEASVSGYSFTSLTGSSFLGVPCPAALDGTITLAPGDVVTCTITNTFAP